MRYSKAAVRRARRGSVLLYVIGAVVVLGGILYAVSSRLPQLMGQRAKSEDTLNLKIALSSLVDYTRYAVKERWCLTEVWTKDSSCVLESHPRATERLLLSNAGLTSANLRLGRASSDSSIRLKEISQSIDLARITATHPLYEIIKAIPRTSKITGVKLTVTRIVDGHIPQTGAEAFIRIRAELLGAGFFSRSTGLFSESVTAFYPREVGSFALLVADSLRLNQKAGTAPPTVGSLIIPRIDTVAQYQQVMTVDPSSGKGGGLRFESPVYVNGNLVLPGSDGGTRHYSPVTFTDTVVLGNGRLMDWAGGEVNFKPASAGGLDDQFYLQSDQFGGFIRGLSLDGERDKGLDYLFGPLSSGATVVDTSLANQCVDRGNVLLDLNRTDSSKALLKSTGVQSNSSNGQNFSYRFGLNLSNRFVLQDIPAAITAATDNFFASPPTLDAPADARPLGKVSVEFSQGDATGSVSAAMTRDSTLKIALKPPADNSSKNPTLTVNLQGVPGDKGPEANKVDFVVSTTDEAFLPSAPKITFRAFDIGSDGQGSSRRHHHHDDGGGSNGGGNGGGNNGGAGGGGSSATDSDLPLELISFDRAGDTGKLSNTVPGTYVAGDGSGAANWTAADDADATKLDDVCRSSGSVSGSAFGVADGDYDFAPNSQHSWHFVPYSPSDNYNSTYEYDLTDQNAHLDPINPSAGSPIFHVRSIAGNCVVKAGANFVAGFFGCRSFTIEPRTTRLRIIGSVITQNLNIDPSAIAAGIRWSTIYYPMATHELRIANILGNGIGPGGCQEGPDPLWSPVLPIHRIQDTFKCNPASLRDLADPFRWTSVDPDCGLPAGQAVNQCKNRARRYIMREIGRTDNI